MEELLLVVHGELDGRTRQWITNVFNLCFIPFNLQYPMNMHRTLISPINRIINFGIAGNNFRGNMLLLLRTLDQLMNSFIKPIIPKEEILGDLRRNNQHADWQCLNRYLLITMASLSSGNYMNIAKLISRWYLGESANDDNKITVTLQNQLQRA